MVVFILFATTCSMSCKAQSESYDWSKVIDAIIQVESEGKTNAVSSDGSSCGILQITRVLVKDVNRILKMKGIRETYSYEDRFNTEKSIEMFKIIQDFYNPRHDVEKAIRLWNGGCGYTIKGTERYYKKVMRKMK